MQCFASSSLRALRTWFLYRAAIPSTAERRLRCTPILLLALGAACAATSSPAVAQTSLSTPIGSTSATQTVTFKMAATGGINNIAMLSEGQSNGEFKLVSSTCAVGNSYSAGTSCTVQYTFSPQLAGLRRGGVSLKDSIGNGLGTAYIAGIGTGPQGVFYQGAPLYYPGEVKSLFNAKFSLDAESRGQMAVDGADNFYFTTVDSYQQAGVWKVTLQGDGTYAATSLALNSYSSANESVAGITVDGLGDIFYAYSDQQGQGVCGIVQLAPLNNGYSSHFIYSTISGGVCPTYLAVDGAGAIYALDPNGNINKFVFNGNGTWTSFVAAHYPHGSTSGQRAWDMAVDGVGNIYLALGDRTQNGNTPAFSEFVYNPSDQSYSEIDDAPNKVPRANAPDGYDLYSAEGVAVDASGSLYIVNFIGTNSLIKAVPGASSLGTGFNTSPFLTNYSSGGPVRIDAHGNIFFVNQLGTGNSLVSEIPADPGTVSFGTITSGTTSAALNFGLTNIGTSPLNISPSGIFLPSGFIQSVGGGTPADCALNTSVLAGNACNLSLEFSPPSTSNGSFGGFFGVYDNHLNATSGAQGLLLIGTAFHPPPVITSLSPATGNATGGSTFVITGTSLGDVSSITFASSFGTLNLAYTINSTTQITAVSSLGNAGSSTQMTVTNPGGSTSATWNFNAVASASKSSLTIAAPTVSQGGTTTLTATVKDSNGNPLNNATVSFASSSPAVASAPTAITNSSGIATSTVSGTSPGSAVFTASVVGAGITQTATLTVSNASVAVGASLGGLKAVVTFASAGKLAGTLAVTQGKNNADFVFTSNSCATNTTFSAGATCTVTYSFNPKAPGLRQGAILLQDASQNILGTAYISGVGSAPLGQLSLGVQSTVASGLNSATDAVVDGSGNVFYSTQVAIMKLSGGNTTVLGNSSYVAGLAVDGAGNLFYGDGVNGKVYEFVQGAGAAKVVASFSYPEYPNGPIAVDGFGNLYVPLASGEVAKLTTGTFATSIVASVSGGGIVSAAVDASGNLFFTDFSNHTVSEVPSGSSAVSTIVSGLSGPRGLAVDAAGNLYVGTITALLRLSAGSYNPTTLASLSGNNAFYGLRIDGNGTLWGATSNSIYELNRASAAPLSFNSNLAVPSAQQVVTLENDGNATLSVTALGSDTPFTLDGSATTCTGSTSLTPTSTPCSLGIVFTPGAVGTVTGTATFTDNSLNVSGTAQTIPLSGAGFGTQTITFPQPSTPVLPGAVTTLTATASSGLPITYTVTAGSATISGSTITYSGTGTVTILASQAGNASYSAATSVSRTVIVGGLTTAIGSTAPTTSATVKITSAGTLNIINVLTKGAANLDFKYVSGSGDPNACQTGISYSVNATCTVQYSFTPARPGQRLGAISLTSNDATPAVMGVALISGTGTGPLAVFPGSTSIGTLGNSTYAAPAGIAVDDNGDVFVADSNNSSVKEIIAVNGVVSSSSTVVTLISGLADPRGLVVDASGDVFVGSGSPDTIGGGTVKKIVAVNGTVSASSSVVTVATGLNFPRGLAMDAAGDLFIADTYNNAVRELIAVNGVVSSGSSVITVGSGFSQPEGLAVDASGNVFVSDPPYESILEIVAVNGLVSSSSTVTFINGVSLQNVSGVAVDSNGDLFVSAPGSFAPGTLGQGASVSELVAVNGVVSSSSPVLTLGSGMRAQALALDGSGHIFIADTNNNAIKRIDLTQAPTLAFGNTVVGDHSAVQTAAVENLGNQPLSISGLAVTSASFTLDTDTTTCGTGSILAAATLCNVGSSFTPQANGAVSGMFNITDNSLNTSSTQQVPLAGTGTTGSTPQTITFSPASSVSNGVAPITFSATGGASGNPVTFTLTSGPATLSGNILTVTGTGSIVVAAHQAGNITYADAPVISRTIAVAAAATSYPANATNVGTTLNSLTATVTFSSSGTLSQIKVLTQGVPGLDYVTASGGTCTPGAAYVSGNACTVNYSFTPSAPGQRLGAIQLFIGNTPAGTVWLSGTGNAPLGLFATGTMTAPYTTLTNLPSLAGATVDAAGNVYYTQAALGAGASGTLSQFIPPTPANPNGTIHLLASGINTATGVRVDGAGNIFFAAYGANTLFELVGGTGTPVNVATMFNPDSNIAVDGAGNIYTTGPAITKVDAVTHTTTSLTSGIAGLGSLPGVAIDASGNLYFSDFNNNKIYKLPANSTTHIPDTTQTPSLVVSTGLNGPRGLAVDPAGNLYVANQTSSNILKLVPSASYAQTIIAAGHGLSVLDIDGAGNLLSTAASSLQVVARSSAALTFSGTTAVNASSAQQVVGFENDGNSPLTFTSIAVDPSFNFSGAGTTCTGSTSLVAGAGCGLGVVFAPLNASLFLALAQITADSMNVSGTVQTLTLIGTGAAIAPTTVIVSPVSIPYGSTTGVTITATESGAAGSVTGGVVTFGTTGGVGGSFSPAACNLTDAGTCTSTYTPSGTLALGPYANDITASFAANNSYLAASASSLLTVSQGTATVALGNLAPTYTGSPLAATATTTPAGLTVTFTYDGSTTAPTTAGSYTVIGTISDANYQGTATGTLVIGQATATVALAGLAPNYTGSPLAATATTNPAGLTVTYTYNGNPTPPTTTGSYLVVGTISDTNYKGTTSGTLVIGRATATVLLASLAPIYTGSPLAATSTTAPAGLTVTYTYDGSTTAPTTAGSYTVIGTINDTNYQGTATGTLVIGQATATITLGSLAPTYTGSPLAATSTTAPAGLTVTYTYDGSPTAPTTAGSYTVDGSINDTNYKGTATGTLVIGQATATVSLEGLAPTYTGSPLAATSTTAPAGLTVTYTYDGSPTAPTTAGSYTVVGSINDTNYKGTATGTLVIGQATATVSLEGLAPTYTGSPLAATSTTAPAGLTVTYTYDGSPTAPTTAGSYTVVGTINDTNYKGTSTDTLKIGRATPALSWPAPDAITYGTPLNGLQLHALSDLDGSYSYTPGAGSVPQGGSQTLSVLFTPEDLTNYTTATATATLQVNPTGQNITFPLVRTNVTYGVAPPVTLTASSDSALPVSYTVSGPATVSGDTLTFTGAGTVVVTAIQTGNASYVAAAPASQQIAVAAAISLTGPVSTTGVQQTLTFTAAAGFTIGSVQVTTDGNLDTAFAVADGGTCQPGLPLTAVQTCTVNVLVTPTAPKLLTGTVTILDNNSPANIVGTIKLVSLRYR